MYELTIQLMINGAAPLYEQIYAYIKEDIQSGKIACGEKLPSTRALCKHLEVSRSTVELAYEQLLSEGYIEAEPCKGFFVAEIEDLYHFKVDVRRVKEAVKEKKQTYRYDFSPNGIDLNSFPYSTWRKLTKDVLSDEKPELFQQGDSQGEYDLRKIISSYLYQSRGVNCEPEQVVVGAGNEYLLMLLSMVIGSKHRIAFENPTYKQAYRVLSNLGYDICAADMDAKGMKVSDLAVLKADIAYVTPSHQYPLGIVMPIKRRMELLTWAFGEAGRYIIEDDYDSEFRYKGKPIPALQGYDRHGKVIYLGTFSKAIAPAIRMSYMVLPETLLQLYRQKAKFMNSTVSKVDQSIVRIFMEQGYYERHLNKLRALYKSRHDKLLAGLRCLQTQCTVSGEHAGVHMLLHFHSGLTEQELIEKAREVRVKVYGLSEYYADAGKVPSATVILGYANIGEDQIAEALKLLEEAWCG